MSQRSSGKRRFLFVFFIVSFIYAFGALLHYAEQPIIPEHPHEQMFTEEERRRIISEKDVKIQELRELVLSDSLLYSRMDDEFLFRFLRVSKMDLRKAFTRLQRYYAFPVTYPELFAKPTPRKHVDIYKRNVAGFLPGWSKPGRKVLYAHVAKWDPDLAAREDGFTAAILFCEMIADNFASESTGVVNVLNMEGLSLRHIRELTPAFMVKAACFIQDIFPAKHVAIHVVNEPSIFNLAYRIVYPFMKTEFREMLYLHGSNYTSLHEFVDPEILPVELDGKAGEFNISDQIDKLLNWGDSTWEKNSKFGYKIDSNDVYKLPTQACSQYGV